MGELVYGHFAGKPLPSTTFSSAIWESTSRNACSTRRYGRLISPSISRPGAGRATVYGLLLHTTQIFAAALSSFPIPRCSRCGACRFSAASKSNRQTGKFEIFSNWSRESRIGRLRAGRRGRPAQPEVAGLGERIAIALAAIGFPRERPLVLLVEENVGKALGQYVSRWGSTPLRLDGAVD